MVGRVLLMEIYNEKWEYMRQKKMTIGTDDYIKANKRLAREEELARNGGRWVAKDRPHKNLKKYDRKREKKNIDSFFPFFYYPLVTRNQHKGKYTAI